MFQGGALRPVIGFLGDTRFLMTKRTHLFGIASSLAGIMIAVSSLFSNYMQMLFSICVFGILAGKTYSNYVLEVYTIVPQNDTLVLLIYLGSMTPYTSHKSN